MAKQPTTPRKRYKIKIHYPYVLAEAFFVGFQLTWALVFFEVGLVWCGVSAAFLAACVMFVAFFYGDHMGRVCFFIDTKWMTKAFAKREAPRLSVPSPEAQV